MMKQFKRFNQRLLSFVLAFCMTIGLVAMVAEQPAEAYNSDNAPVAKMSELEETSLKYAFTDGGTGFRVIDGKLWVWGSNTAREFGFTEYEGKVVDTSTVFANPVKHPFEFDGAIEQVIGAYRFGCVRTAPGSVYVWGNDMYFGKSTHGELLTPTKMNTDAVINDGGFASLQGTSVGMVARSKNGHFFIIGSQNYIGATTENGSDLFTFQQVTESFIDMLQPSYDKTASAEDNAAALQAAGENVGGAKRWLLENIVFSGSGFVSTFIVRQKNGTKYRVYGMSSGAQPGQHFLYGVQPGVKYPYEMTNTEQYKDALPDLYAANTALIAAEPCWDTMTGSRFVGTVIDKDGNVWGASSHNGSGVVPYRATKIFDRRVTQVKAIKAVAADSLVVILGEDNSVWAYGKNANQFIDPTQPASTVIREATCVFKDQSMNQTITGMFITNVGVMLITKSGDQYYAGDNTGGTAGNGTQSNEGFGAGQVGEATSSAIPPVEPMTSNKVYFEFETNDALYYKTDDGIVKKVTYNEKGEALEPVTVQNNLITLIAGSIVKLHVYFYDVARMNGFVMPIRFDPTYIRVVNGEGREYPANEVSTPGAIGASVGITREFTTREWAGGYLLGEGDTSGEYPKICNSGGWVSVMGHSLDPKAKIEGKVEMFTVNFTVIKTTEAATTFLIADSKNANTFIGDALSVPKYDETGLNQKDCGGGFIVSNNAAGGADGEFKFKETYGGGFPMIDAQVVRMRSIALSVTKADGSIPQNNEKDEDGIPITRDDDNTTNSKGWILPSGNTSETYVVKSTPDPANSSFPAVDWSMTLENWSGPKLKSDTQEEYVLSDFIGMQDPQDTTLRFKLSDTIDKNQTALIKVRAVTREFGTNNEVKQATTYIIIKPMAGPPELRIAEKKDLIDGTITYTSTDADYLAGQITKFTVEFPGMTGDPTFSNTAVVWRLFDQNGVEITASTVKAPAYITSITGATGRPYQYNVNEELNKWIPPSATITPAHSTMGDTYLTLQVESAYDSSKCDSIKIMVHLNATSLKFKRDLLRLPTKTSKDLNDLLEIGPESDYYEVNLVWSYEGFYHLFPSTGKQDAQKVDPTGQAYDSVLQMSATGVVTADTDFTQEGVCEVIKVTDTISGLSDIIAVRVLSLESPIKPSQIHVYNVVGDKGDYAIIEGVQAGDILTFYKEYSPDIVYDYEKPLTEQSTAFKNANKLGYIQQFGPLTAYQVKSGKLQVSLQDFLYSLGGELGMSVTRYDDAADVKKIRTFDQVPVSYDCEPSKVYGYISLAGKNSTTDRRDRVAVQLAGPSNPDVVYTDVNGYFEFKTYIRPGTYSLTIYQDNYLRRVIQPDAATGYAGIVIPAAEEFAISTDKNPIELYPGDLNDDGAINATDINQYIRSWVGKTIKTEDTNTFSHYDFYDSGYEVIDLSDLDIVARHNGWTRENYPNWNIPTVK